MKFSTKKMASSNDFQSLTFFAIILTSLSIGLETIPEMAQNFSTVFALIYYATQTFFVCEIAIRILSYSPNYKKFFKDFWNNFDFVIVILSFLPVWGAFAITARLLRLLRVFRLVSTSVVLKGFIHRLKDTFDEALFTGLIVMVLSYFFTVAGYYLFNEIDPGNWGSLWDSVLSVFYLLLFQDVKDYVKPLVEHSKFALLFFALFYFSFITLLISAMSAAVNQYKESKKCD